MNYFTSLFRRAERKRPLSDLLKLDDHLLRDIGLTRSGVVEMRKRNRGASLRGHE